MTFPAEPTTHQDHRRELRAIQLQRGVEPGLQARAERAIFVHGRPQDHDHIRERTLIAQARPDDRARGGRIETDRDAQRPRDSTAKLHPAELTRRAPCWGRGHMTRGVTQNTHSLREPWYERTAIA